MRKHYGITVVCIKPQGGSFTYATPETVASEGDILVVAGEKARAEAFGGGQLSAFASTARAWATAPGAIWCATGSSR